MRNDLYWVRMRRKALPYLDAIQWAIIPYEPRMQPM